MKRFIIILTAALLLMAGCGKTQSKEVKLSEVMQNIMTQLELSDGDFFSSDFEDIYQNADDDYLNGKFGMNGEAPTLQEIEEYAMFMSVAMYNPEIGIFKMKTEQAANDMKQQIEERIDYYVEYAGNYPSIDTSLIHSAIVKKQGNVVYFAITSDSAKTIADIESAIFE